MKHVLVVDDSPVIRKVARRILEGMNFQTSEADSGAAGLQSCEEFMPDAIFLDWNLPEMEGCEFIRRLQKLPRGDLPKIVLCTTENDILSLARAFNAGAHGYVLKPFDKHIMQAKFEQIGFVEAAA